MYQIVTGNGKMKVESKITNNGNGYQAEIKIYSPSGSHELARINVNSLFIYDVTRLVDLITENYE